MKNASIAALFAEAADLLEVQDANPFRVRAYRNASRAVKNHPEQFAAILDREPDAKLEAIKGIGTDLAAKIREAVAESRIAMVEELRSEVPPVTLELFRLPGLGPKKVATLVNELELQTVDDLKAAAADGRVAGLSGFGVKTAGKIVEGLEQLDRLGNRTYLETGLELAERVRDDLAALPGTTRCEVAGSARRRKETVGDLDLLLCGDGSAAMDALADHPLVEKTLARGGTKQRVRLAGGPEMDLRVVAEESFGAALQYFTGSQAHNIAVRRVATDKGYKLNEYGLFCGDERHAGASEDDVYAALGMPVFPPELREDRREFAWAETQLPTLIELSDVRGDLHMHTTATDGKNSITEMAEAAAARGLEYVAITDHSKRVTMAGGLDARRLRKHWDDIRHAAADVSGVEVLCGIECDILEDATMDLPDEVLADADWVLAVLHYGLRQPAEKIERRLLSAIDNPHVHCIGHPTGRIVGKREGADADWLKVLDAAAAAGAMMEINANPARLDLDDSLARAAADRGVPITISTDAHSLAGLEKMRWGVYQARRAGLEAKDVANTRPLAEFRALLRS